MPAPEVVASVMAGYLFNQIALASDTVTLKKNKKTKANHQNEVFSF